MITNFRFTDWDAGPISPINFMDRKYADLLAGRVTITFGARHLHPTAHESFLFPGNPLGEYDCLVLNDPGHNHSSLELVRLWLWEKRHFIRSFDGYITICRQPNRTILSSSDVCCSTEPISCTGQREITLHRRRKWLVSEDLERARYLCTDYRKSPWY